MRKGGGRQQARKRDSGGDFPRRPARSKVKGGRKGANEAQFRRDRSQRPACGIKQAEEFKKKKVSVGGSP